MKRPIGLILSAIALSLAALFFLLMAAVIALAGVFGPHSASQPMPHFFIYLMLAISLFYAALSVWAILTVIGILRLRSWGRYSILIIGGGLTVISVFAIFGTLVSRTMFPTLQAQQRNVDSHSLTIVLMVMAAVYALVAAIGIWWLIYFNLRSIRNLFNSPAPVQTYYAPLSPEAYGTTGTLNSPVDPSNGFFSSPAHAPTAIKIIGWLFLIGAIFCLPMAFLPVPAFFLGFIIPVKASRFLFLAVLIIGPCIGYGLLKLWNSARLATIAFVSFGLVNSAISLLPWYQNQLRLYMAQFMTRFIAMIPTLPGQPATGYLYPTSTIIFNSLLAVAINIYLLWLLHRHRTAFTAPPPLPEQS